MAVVIGAATAPLKDLEAEKEKERRKRKRAEEGDISDDEFDSDGERVEEGDRVRKKVKVGRILEDLRGEGVNVDIGIPKLVVEEGVGIVKQGLEGVVVWEDL